MHVFVRNFVLNFLQLKIAFFERSLLLVPVVVCVAISLMDQVNWDRNFRMQLHTLDSNSIHYRHNRLIHLGIWYEIKKKLIFYYLVRLKDAKRLSCSNGFFFFIFIDFQHTTIIIYFIRTIGFDRYFTEFTTSRWITFTLPKIITFYTLSLSIAIICTAI